MPVTASDAEHIMGKTGATVTVVPAETVAALNFDIGHIQWHIPGSNANLHGIECFVRRLAAPPLHCRPSSLRHAAITNALPAGVPLRDAQILARHADPRTTQHNDRARGNLDHHGVHFLTAYVAGVSSPKMKVSGQASAPGGAGKGLLR